MPIIFAPLKILDEIASDLYATTKSLARNSKEVFIRGMEVGVNKYITTKHNRYSKVHTLLSPHEPLKIDQIYVHPSFSIGENVHQGNAIIEVISENKITVVQAIAGQGKSMLLRHIFCTLCEINYGFIPIFIELRNIDFINQNIVEVAYSEFSDDTNAFSFEAFGSLLKSGRVVFLLDGYDEIKTSNRKIALEKIEKVSKEYAQCRIVITSRPSDSFNGWHPASIMIIKDYELAQIVELIMKSPIAGEVKDAFIRKVEQEYINTHDRFLSNPLLCNMMTLTFMRGGDIPSQKHIFYRKAFDTLYKHHDDMKFLYKRDYHSDLPEDMFVRLWRAFCYFSYIDRKFSFDADELHNYISHGAKYINRDITPEKVAQDFVESLCILVKDGDSYSFLHRSFQEYAVALFISTERLSGYVEIVDRLVHNVHDDDVLDLAFQMNRELLEQEYIIKRLDILIKKMKRKSKMIGKMQLFYSGATIDSSLDGEDAVFFSVSLGAERTPEIYFTHFVRRNYSQTYKNEINQRVKEWLQAMRAAVDGVNIRARFSVEFSELSEADLRSSPMAELLDLYLTGFEEARQEIRDRQRHQRKMLRLPT